MKKLFFAVVLCIMIRPAMAQDDSLPRLRNEVGFDMSYFLNIFRNQYEPSNTTVFILTYEREVSRKLSLRANIGIGILNNTDRIVDTLPSIHDKSTRQVYKLGVEDRIESGKWEFYFGLDLKLQSDDSKYESLNATYVATTTEKNKYIGPAPFMGIKFFITKRISLSTETFVDFIYSEKKIVESSTDPAVLPTRRATFGFNTNYAVPQNIFLNYDF